MVYDKLQEIRKEKEKDKTQSQSQGCPYDDNDTNHSITIKQAAQSVAAVLHVNHSRLFGFVVSHFDDASLLNDVIKKKPPRIENTKKVMRSYILEALSLMRARHARGEANNYNVIMAHLKSEERIHPCLTIFNCPPVEFSKSVLSYALRNVSGYGWGETRKCGILQVSPIKQEQQLWRKWYYLIEHHRNLKLQHVEQSHIIISRDESFVHEMHNGKSSLLPRDENGDLMQDINRQVRNGRRICMSGGLTCYGHYTGYYQLVDGTWTPFRDCIWINKDGEEVDNGGNYVELSGEINETKGTQTIRKIYRKAPKFKSLNVSKVELIRIAQEEGVPDIEITNKSGTQVYCNIAELKAKILAKRTTVANSTDVTNPEPLGSDIESSYEFPVDKVGKGQILNQMIFTDWDKLKTNLQDLAPTGDRFFIAYDHKGDYHDNFDSIMTYKIFVGMIKTWPYFLQHLQRVKDIVCDNDTKIISNHQCPIYGNYVCNKADPLYGVHVNNFYDWESNKCLRDMIVEQDNAPYNHGVELQMSTLSREKCANLLRQLTIKSIQVKSNVILNVPEVDQAWVIPEQHDGTKIYADDIRVATRTAIMANHAHLLEPGYMQLCKEFKIIVTFTAPYTSPICCIEFKWQVGKGYVAQPMNEYKGRSCKQVVDLLREKWYFKTKEGQEPLDMNIFVQHCHSLMNESITEYKKTSSGIFPLDGKVTDIFSDTGLIGYPTTEEAWLVFKRKAGIADSYIEDQICGDDAEGDLFYEEEIDENELDDDDYDDNYER